ncbi:MAG TPA: (Fe-S)-binding protein [Desulfobulbaceae bacterium]|nr:(Fe-S)-binding protein [Desulfobulbaceae bacterium]
MKNPSLADYHEAMRQCVKCGACQAKCPTYRLTRREGAVARGKIALASALADGEIAMENALLRDLDFCLLCGGCATACPNAVPTPEIVAAVRREISAQRGFSPLTRGIARLTASPKLLKMAARMAAAGETLAPGIVAKRIPEESGLRLRLPKAMAGRLLPQIPRRNLFDRLPEKIAGQPGKPTIGFFAGCGLTYLFPHVGEMAVHLLNRLGYSVLFPKNQGCCGIPATSCGDGAAVERLAARNVNAFAGADIIVTACASCYSGIGAYRAMGAADFSGKTVEFCDFIVRERLQDILFAEKKDGADGNSPAPWRRVTWHDPCHLKRHGLTAAPRKILANLPGIDFIEMAGASLCCGLGGSFSLKHYDASKAIGAAKIPGLQASEAELVITSCPGCLVQLQDTISRAGLNIRVAHVVEVLADATAGKYSLKSGQV